MVFDIFKNELDGKRGRTGDPVRARGRLLIKPEFDTYDR